MAVRRDRRTRARRRHSRHADAGRVRTILFGADASGGQAERPRSNHQRIAGSFEGGTYRLDRGAVGLRRVRHSGEVVVVAEVDDALGGGGTGPQAVQVIQLAAQHVRAERCDRGRR
jgi:hypothetical protein